MKRPDARGVKSGLRKAAGRFLLALSFLSRLAPARLAAESEVYASLAWYPAAGLTLGLALSLPFALLDLAFPGRIAGKAWLAALCFTALHAWLTRALHWDGWADLFDALGGGGDPESFRRILKDSRLGVFGGLALALGFAAMLMGAAYCLAARNWPALLWAVLLGRCLVALLAWRGSPLPGSGLGRLLLSADGSRRSGLTALSALLFAVAAGVLCVGLHTALAATAAALGGLCFLRRTARRRGGLNGDYMGAAIVWGELAGLLTAAWLQNSPPV